MHLRIAGELIARRAPRASSARQYAMTYATFCDWLGAQLSRPPLVGDLTADTVAAYARHLELAGGRGGGPASPATRRQRLVLIQALAHKLGLDGGGGTDPAALAPPRATGDPQRQRVRKPHPRSRRAHPWRAPRPGHPPRTGRLRAAQRRTASAECPLPAPTTVKQPPPQPSTYWARATSSARSPCPPRPTMPYARWLDAHPHAGAGGTLADHELLFCLRQRPGRNRCAPRTERRDPRPPRSPTRCAPTTPPPWPPKASPSTASPDALGMPPSKPPAATWPKPTATSPP